MTKPSLPGCMQSELVSCPYEVWGPRQPHPEYSSQALEEGLEEPEKKKGDTPAYTSLLLPSVDANLKGIYPHFYNFSLSAVFKLVAHFLPIYFQVQNQEIDKSRTRKKI